MKGLTKEEFFKQLAVNSGQTDLETVKNIFYGLVRTMSKELRGKHTITLPDWGTFNLKIHKERNAYNTNSKKVERLKAKPTIKFSPDYKVKIYFHALGDEVL